MKLDAALLTTLNAIIALADRLAKEPDMIHGDSQSRQAARKTVTSTSRSQKPFISQLSWRVGSAPRRQVQRAFLAKPSRAFAKVTRYDVDDNSRSGPLADR